MRISFWNLFKEAIIQLAKIMASFYLALIVAPVLTVIPMLLVKLFSKFVQYEFRKATDFVVYVHVFMGAIFISALQEEYFKKIKWLYILNCLIVILAFLYLPPDISADLFRFKTNWEKIIIIVEYVVLVHFGFLVGIYLFHKRKFIE